MKVRSECLRVLDLSLFHIVPKAVHLEDFVSLQNQVMERSYSTCKPLRTRGCRGEYAKVLVTRRKPHNGGNGHINILSNRVVSLALRFLATTRYLTGSHINLRDHRRAKGQL